MYSDSDTPDRTVGVKSNEGVDGKGYTRKENNEIKTDLVNGDRLYDT